MIDLGTLQVLPRTVRRTTPLGEAIIFYPGSDPAYRPLAETLAQAVAQRCGIRPAVLADSDVLVSRSTPLPRRYRQHTLVILGSLNTNRALLPLYARYLCATDATYPGGDGYDLRILINPYGTGTNVILAGGSRLAGVRRAVERLVEHLSASDGDLPFLLEVDLEPSVARALANWSDAPLSSLIATDGGLRQTHQLNEDVMKQIGAYGIMYAWTGDRRYGQRAADLLKALNDQMTDSYGDWHYRAERVLRVLPWLVAGGFLEDAEILRTDHLLLGTALGTEAMWWRMRDGKPPLGHRHHGRGTFEFLLLARYLLEQANPNNALRERCLRWISESQAYLDALGQAGIDDQDDESTLTNLATVFWYALSEERYDFFESGSARRVAERAIALHDNMGAGAGQGGYGEGFPGTMYLQQEATIPVAVSAFYYQDGGLKWVLEHLPHLSTPLISGFLHFSPLFMHLFHTGAELSAAPPDDLIGLRVLPITPHQYAISTTPLEHIEPLGHAVNAPETWLRGEGIGVNALAPEQGFDKIILRGGFAPTDSYLLLQGYQGGFRWQGHMQAANCIVRFSQSGHIFLIQNTSRHSHYFKNGLFIGDGSDDIPIPPIAERVASADFERAVLTTTRLRDFHHADWTRHIFWSKTHDLFVVIDTAAFQQDGEYNLICTWRTPGYAQLGERVWRARQGDHQFSLTWSESLTVTSEEETDQGAAVPYVLRQRQAGAFHAGDVAAFQNLFYVRPESTPGVLALRKLDTRQTLVTLDDQLLALCAIADSDQEIRCANLTLRAVSVWLSADELIVCGMTRLSLDEKPGLHFECSQPINLSLDFASGRLSATAESDTLLSVNLESVSITVPVAARTASVYLPGAACRAIVDILRHLGGQRQAAPDTTPSPDFTEVAGRWSPVWSFKIGTLIPQRLRDLTVTAEPPLLDGFAEQLIDGVVPEIRQTRQQWTPAERYEIMLTLPEETPLDQVRIVGDSQVDPTLRTFHSLPADISVAVSSDGFCQDVREVPVSPESGVLRYKLFRDIEDRLEIRSAHVGAQGAQIRVRVPAPADGSPLVLHEIEVYGSERVAPPVEQLLSADLYGNGEQVVLAVNAAHELIALSEQGTELWRQQLLVPLTHLSTHDLHGDGLRSICVGLVGGELRIFSADGSLETTIPLAQHFSQQPAAYFGRVYAVHAAQVWQRDSAGRAALVVGGYSAICFLDPEGEIIGHSWADGSWQCNILISPGSGDLWVRNGWNHGISVYEGERGFAPCSESVAFGGVRQPMFRGIRRVIPFVNGKTIAYEWLDEDILVAAENGVGLLSTEQRDWLWKIEGSSPITACVASEAGVIVGGADGFITAFAQADGHPQRKRRCDSPATGLAALSAGRLALATCTELLLLDSNWRVEQRYACPVRSLAKLGQNKLVIARADGVLEMFVDEGNVS